MAFLPVKNTVLLYIYFFACEKCTLRYQNILLQRAQTTRYGNFWSGSIVLTFRDRSNKKRSGSLETDRIKFNRSQIIQHAFLGNKAVHINNCCKYTSSCTQLPKDHAIRTSSRYGKHAKYTLRI